MPGAGYTMMVSLFLSIFSGLFFVFETLQHSKKLTVIAIGIINLMLHKHFVCFDVFIMCAEL